jgi:outer membrane protein insertion porin family
MGMHGHVFADSGSIARLSGKHQAPEGLQTFWDRWRLSFGAGIKLPFTRYGHFELNFVHVLKSHGRDQAVNGFQFGFAAEPYLATRPRDM